MRQVLWAFTTERTRRRGKATYPVKVGRKREGVPVAAKAGEGNAGRERERALLTRDVGNLMREERRGDGGPPLRVEGGTEKSRGRGEGERDRGRIEEGPLSGKLVCTIIAREVRVTGNPLEVDRGLELRESEDGVPDREERGGEVKGGEGAKFGETRLGV